jgi:hypothetical protein
LLYLSSALATKGSLLALPLVPVRKGVIPGFLVHFYVLFALYLGSVWSVFRGRVDGRVLAIILIAYSKAGWHPSFRATIRHSTSVTSMNN